MLHRFCLFNLNYDEKSTNELGLHRHMVHMRICFIRSLPNQTKRKIALETYTLMRPREIGKQELEVRR